LFLNCAESEKGVLYSCSYKTKRPGSDQTPRRTPRVFDQNLFFLSLHKVGFPYEVTYVDIDGRYVAVAELL